MSYNHAVSRYTRTSVFVAGLAAFIGVLMLRARTQERAERSTECAALAAALDKTFSQNAPRVSERIVEHHWDAGKSRCLASLEYHYKPCDAAAAKKSPAACAGPDADIGVYAFLDGGAKPLVMCERVYATNSAACVESVYGGDGTLLTSRDLPPEQFPPLKDELFERRP